MEGHLYFCDLSQLKSDIGEKRKKRKDSVARRELLSLSEQPTSYAERYRELRGPRRETCWERGWEVVLRGRALMTGEDFHTGGTD